MDSTLDILPGEGDEKTRTLVHTRRTCSECGSPAHYKHTFLLINGRNNRGSSAYGRDDCTWCEDSCQFVCQKHQLVRTAPDGMEHCATFPATARFAHLFLHWVEK